MTPVIRAATVEDMGYVRHAWAKSVLSTMKSELFHLSRPVSGQDVMKSGMRGTYKATMPMSLYQRLLWPVIGRIIDRSKVIVAVNPDDDTQLLGFCCYGSDALLYFISVKFDFMNRGIAKAMLAHAGLVKTASVVYAFPSSLASVPKPWIYVPWYLHAEIYK